MMDPPVPIAEDHCRILILVRPLGHRSATHFNHLMERLSRVEAIQVSENPKRIILAKFISQVNPDMRSFGEFQAHRRIFGVVGVAHAVSPQRHKMSVTSLDDSLISQTVPLPLDHRATMELVQQQYEMLKADYSETSVDSRIATFGFKGADECFSERELLAFPTLEDSSDGLEVGIREFVRQIYFVLESRRLDLAFEKMDSPTCPLLPEEEKYRAGVENRHSKAYKRKCIGRLRKQVADYTLLTGLPTLALDSYQSAIDYLKQGSDLLWLAAALEGWACAAIAIKYNETAERLKKNASMQRVSTLTPSQMRAFQEKANQHSLGRTSIGHQRYHSDAAAVDERAIATAAAAAAQLMEQDAQLSKQNHLKKPWHTLTLDRSPSNRSTIDHSEILEKFRSALENYERFSFAAFIEYECMMKAASVFRHQKMLIETEAFIRDHIGKYLDDSFTLFDHLTKANICMNCATVYKEIGFFRKNAFYARLAVLFRLHMTENDCRTESDYRQVYPILYRTLVGYGIRPQSRELASSNLATAGPVAVQVKALHEVFMSAMRARYFDAAIRHLCYILEVYFDELEPTAAMRMFEELERLVGSRPTMHVASQPIAMDQCGIILPPLQMTRFPMMKDFKVIPLAADLAPTVVKKDDKSNDIFIYSPFQNRNNDVEPVWVAGCPCEIAVTVKNPFPFEFSVKNLALIGDGCAFEAVPVKLNLASAIDNPDSSTIRLLGMPREPGKLRITGYSCEVVGVKNVCRLKNESGQKPFEVDVLPALPELQLETSLPRAPVTEDEADPAAETTVFSGQRFLHSVTIVNKSATIGIESVKLEVKQPKVFGGPSLIQLVFDDEDSLSVSSEPREYCVSLAPKERKYVKFRIFGIDPSATADDEQAAGSTIGASTVRHSDLMADKEVNNRGSILADVDSFGTPPVGQSHHDLIPYTGRLLTAEFIFTYTADVEGPEGEKYERTSRLPLAVTIMPAVTVSNWHVLPGDGPATRYVVVDVTNSTDFDAELTYSQNRMIGVQSREVCRVPLLCPCCTEVRASAFQDAAKRASHMMQMQEMEKLRRTLEHHVAKHLDIRWSVPQMKMEGTVPVGSMLASVSLLKQLVIPTMSVGSSLSPVFLLTKASLDTTVNGVPYTSEDDLQIRIAEPIMIGITLLSSMRGERPFSGMLSLNCYQDLQNGLPTVDRNDHMVICGSTRIPFTIETRPKTSPNKTAGGDEVVLRKLTRTMTSYRADFTVMFRHEGTYKVKPVVLLPNSSSPAFTDEEFFVSPVSFNVVTKVN
uniref:Trafficking protein particle complex subunit 9 n=1 Tax=Steinernema glaseri TaxID=37863 RepID=A0A1I8AA06_9BILA